MMSQMLKNVILLVAVDCGVSAQAGVCAVVAWPFKTVAAIQRGIFTTKTTQGKACLGTVALFQAYTLAGWATNRLG